MSKWGYLAITADPVDIAVYGWAARWDAERIRGCFNEMPTWVAERIAAAGSAEEVRAIMAPPKQS